MRSPFRGLPIAWLQLRHGRTKLVAAVVGIVFADLLMWMQLGFLGAALASATTIHRQLRGDLVILNPHTHQITSPQPFARRLLTRAKGHPDVEAVTPLYMGTAKWRDPWTRDKQPLFVYGVVPYSPAIGAAGVMEAAGLLHETDTCLFDAMSRKEFGQVAARSPAGEPVEAEVNGLRRMRSWARPRSGPTSPSTATWSRATSNFLRLFPGRPPGSVDLGVVRLRRGRRPPGQVRAGQDLRARPDGADDRRDHRPRDRIPAQVAADQLHLHARGRRRLPRRLRDRLPGAVHRREQPPAAIRDAQGDRLFRWLPAAGRAGRVAHPLVARLSARRRAGLGPVCVRRQGDQPADADDRSIEGH